MKPRKQPSAGPRGRSESVSALCFYLDRCGNVATVTRNGKCLCQTCSDTLTKYQEYPLNFKLDRHGNLTPLGWYAIR